MGSVIENLLIAKNHEVVLKVDQSNKQLLTPDELKKADVAIEFTVPSAAPSNLRACLKAGIPVVCGTTGWNDQMPDIFNEFEKNDGALFYASNFSIGVNLLFQLNRILAGWMNRFQGYSASVTEIHHTRKADIPSGTAITLAEDISKENPSYKGWRLIKGDEVPDSGEIPIHAYREDEVTGIHTVEYNSVIDSLRLHHHAHNRDGFGSGAVMAAEWIIGRKGVYGMKDLLFPSGT